VRPDPFPAPPEPEAQPLGNDPGLDVHSGAVAARSLEAQRTQPRPQLDLATVPEQDPGRLVAQSRLRLSRWKKIQRVPVTSRFGTVPVHQRLRIAACGKQFVLNLPELRRRHPRQIQAPDSVPEHVPLARGA
jgi:hypothetical protein